jgi:hypothetical protein
LLKMKASAYENSKSHKKLGYAIIINGGDVD